MMTDGYKKNRKRNMREKRENINNVLNFRLCYAFTRHLKYFIPFMKSVLSG